MDRRELFAAVGAITASALPLAGCRTMRAAAELKEEAAALGWLQSIGPILPAKFPQTDFNGDQPAFTQKWLQNVEMVAAKSAPDESAELVIVGGGLAGLAAAYLLRDAAPILLDAAPNFGGTARGESWEGVQYSLGSTTLKAAEDGSSLDEHFYRPLDLRSLWRQTPAPDVIYKNQVCPDFWDGATASDPAAEAQTKAMRDYLRAIARSEYPELPPQNPDAVPDAIKRLDMMSFLAHLEGAVGAPLAAHLRAVIEHFSWVSFGAAASEISAAAGLNGLAASLSGGCALPGGNATLASLLLGAVATAGVPAEHFRVSSPVRRIEHAKDHVLVHVRNLDGTDHVIAAKAVVVACPKLIARRIIRDIPPDQADAMANLRYRSALVANILLDGKIAGNRYALTYVADDGETFTDAGKAAARQKAVTGVFGHWAQTDATKSVLTLCRSFPMDEGQALLARSGAFSTYRDEFLKQLPNLLAAFGGVAVPGLDRVRVTRWEHPFVIPAPGLIATGIAQRAAAPMGDRIFFCNKDDWALPTAEACLTSAIHVAPKVKAILG